MSKDADVIVIGGGIIGCSVTYQLSKLGKKVLQIEREELTRGAAGATDGVVGYHTKKPGAQMDLAVQSIAMFEHLGEELGEDIEYGFQCGGMQPVEDQLQWDILSEIVEEQKKSGVDIRMISIDEARKIEPMLAKDLKGALYSPTGGKVNPIKLTMAFSRAAKKLGAVVKTETEVTDLIIEGQAVKGVKTTRGDYHADIVVNACGAWAANIGKMAGLDIPIQPRKGQLIVTEPIGQFMDATLQCARYNVIKFRPDAVDDPAALKIGNSLSIEQTETGGMIIGGTREFAGYDRENTLEAIETILRRAVRFFPALKDICFIRAFAGLRPYTPDGLPLIGKVNALDGFYMAAGHEGDGIALSPITGKLLAEQIVYGKESYSLESFDPNRFPLKQEA
ncbi:MAG: FAD-binding oxidoreductase [Clostridia bacterium]|nr:FAD-binding oxidoreductase [Clostridia bacterium]NCC43770.1 FAD-binding oxidoreductase [Clostridia bacterium]